MECYLDNSATTKVLPGAVEIMNKIYTEDYGNPSSLHNKGFDAEKYLRTAFETFSGILKCKEKNLIFTSGGTESNNTALIGTAIAKKGRGKHIITTGIEHPAVSRVCDFLKKEGFEITVLSVDKEGLIDLAELEAALRSDTILVSVMHVNNEIGALEPIKEIGRLIKQKAPDALFHVDDIQGFGKLRLIPSECGIDMLSASSHKIHGPKGVGLLYTSDRVHISPLIFGGGQMHNMRSGTENVPGIAGFSFAAKEIYKDIESHSERLYSLREDFINRITALKEIHVNGSLDRTKAAPHIISVSTEGVRSEVLLHALEEKGIYVSAGSACSSNHKSISPTLSAIGVPKWALESTVRFSLSVFTTKEELDTAADALSELVPQLARYSRR
ncbi:MAG: cysteine desulfurase [Lachnospiraceae bacterium]|nr:cysteine desulfurase [Lachnospiraceae bacterium]